MTAEAADDLATAWQEILERRPLLQTDRKLAGLALGVIREMGNTRAHRDVLRELASAWTQDWRLLLTAASMLVEQAGRRGMDEPPVTDDGPAWWAAAGLQRALGMIADQFEPGHVYPGQTDTGQKTQHQRRPEPLRCKSIADGRQYAEYRSGAHNFACIYSVGEARQYRDKDHVAGIVGSADPAQGGVAQLPQGLEGRQQRGECGNR